MKTTVKIFALITFFSLISCEKELYQEKLSQEKNKSEISFEQFKNETGLSDFKTTISINQNESSTLARNADGSYELSDFVIDTELINKLVVQEKVTYTFVITPKVITNRNIFNLNIFKVNGEWKISILELIPTEQNRIDLQNGLTDKFEGEIKQVYDNSKTNDNPIGARVIIVHHCTGCVGECDLCPDCVSVLVYQDPQWIGGSFIPGGGIPYITEPAGGNGQSGNLLTNPFYSDPSGYVFEPNISSIADGITTIRAERATEFWNSLTEGVDGQKAWASNHQEEYSSLLNYLLDNFSSNNAQKIRGLIQISITHGGTFEFDSIINADNAMVFSTLNEFNNFLVNQTDEGTDFEYLEQQNQKIASTKFWIGAPYNGVKVNIKQNMITPYSVENVTSEMFGVTVFADWNQSDYSVSITNNVVTVDVFGVSSVKVFFEGVGTIYHENQYFRIRINKSNGTIISSTVIH